MEKNTHSTSTKFGLTFFSCSLFQRLLYIVLFCQNAVNLVRFQVKSISIAYNSIVCNLDSTRFSWFSFQLFLNRDHRFLSEIFQ